MLFDRFDDFPVADKTGRENDQIAFPEIHSVTIIGGNDDIAFQQVAGFLLTVVPGKFRYLLGPDWPVEDPPGFQDLGVGIMGHMDTCHRHSPFA